MKFWCSKIRINEKEVIKSVVTWEEDGVEKGWYKSSEKEDQKKMGKGLKNQIMLLVFSGVTHGTAPFLSCK